VQDVTGGSVGVTVLLVGGQDVGVGQVRAELIGDEFRGPRPVGPHADHVAHRGDEIVGGAGDEAVRGRDHVLEHRARHVVLLVRKRGCPVQRLPSMTHSSNANFCGYP
jgi:hypothetical protein